MAGITRMAASEPAASAAADAIRKGDTGRLAGLLAAHPGLAAAAVVDDKGAGRTLLHIATDWPGHFPNVAATIELLANAGADPGIGLIDSPVDACETPLHWAASSNDVAAIDALLDNGADIEAPGAIFTGGTPMSDAVVFGQWDAARALLRRGAQTTPWQAAALGLLDQVQAAFGQSEGGADVTAALWHACHAGQQEVAEYLVDCGGDIDWVGFNDWTPLRAAKEGGHKALAKRLRARAHG